MERQNSRDLSVQDFLSINDLLIAKERNLSINESDNVSFSFQLINMQSTCSSFMQYVSMTK